jgi:precorrin-4 methylase
MDEALDQVVLPSGREVDVVPSNGAAAELLQEFDRTKAKDPLLLWRAVHQMIPAATDEEVKQLTPKQCAAVIAIAGGKADRVIAYMAEEAEKKKKEREGNPEAATKRKPRGRRRETGSAS